MSSPAIILKSKFVLPDKKDYNDYVSYIDRDDAKVNLEVDRESRKESDFNLYYSYMDYMGDEEKQGSLFTNSKDKLSEDEKKKLKDEFVQAQKNGSPMWQDVISFDNDWLEKHGLYNSETKVLKEHKIKSAIRSSVSELIKREKMNSSTVWSASIHYNTDNIHVHIAMVEKEPSREKIKVYNEEKGEWEEQFKARRKKGSLERMKSVVASKILDRSEKYNEIDAYIRGAVRFKKENNIQLSSDERTKKLFMKAISLLPHDMKQWQYGYKSVDKARPYIDEIVEIYLDTYHKDDIRKLDELLDEQVDISKELYGEGSNYKQYKKTKLDDLKKRMGNAVLAEMREFAKMEREDNYFTLRIRRYRIQKNKNPFYRENEKMERDKPNNLLNQMDFAVIRLKNAMRKKYHEYALERNIEEYDRMLEGYDY